VRNPMRTMTFDWAGVDRVSELISTGCGKFMRNAPNLSLSHLTNGESHRTKSSQILSHAKSSPVPLNMFKSGKFRLDHRPVVYYGTHCVVRQHFAALLNIIVPFSEH